MLARICALAFGLGIATSAMGYSGNDLLSDLKSGSNEGFFALGYVVGTTDILGVSGFLGSCYKQPDGVTHAQK